MNNTKIDWCDCTANPVKGCPNGCKYCYGRKINDRFHLVKDWSKPQFFPEVLKQFKSKKPKSIFIDSMSDIGCWKDEWLEQVFKAMAENPQHKYIALSKCYARTYDIEKRYLDYVKAHNFNTFNLWIGNTLTTQEKADAFLRSDIINDFLSVEPLLEPIDLCRVLPRTDSVIIGAETGNRKGKVIPQKEWVQDIIEQCCEHNTTVFMKESLREIMGDEFRQDRLPWEIKR